MNNNDVLRRLRYALELDNTQLQSCLREAGVTLQLDELAARLKGDEEPGAVPMSDEELTALLDGFVSLSRGRREPAAALASPPEPSGLTNNRILRALKIALSLKDTDVQAIMELAGVPVSKTELSALFRREDHRNYQPCGNQFLRSFLKGLGVWHRDPRRRA